MSWFPDTTTTQLMCGCYPPEKCEVKGKDITGTTHFCHVCRTTLISGLCIGNMITEAEAAGDETFSASRVKCRSCTISPYVENKRKARNDSKKVKEGIFTSACLMCGLGNGALLNKDGMCRECAPNQAFHDNEDDVDSVGSDPDESDNEESISKIIDFSDVAVDDSVIPEHNGQSFTIEIAGKQLVYNMMDASKFGHLNPGTRKMPGRMAYYSCEFYRGTQNDVLFHQIDTYAFRCIKGPDSDLLAFCGLQIFEEENVSSISIDLPKYVLCAILVGLCGKRFLMIYNCESKKVEDWGSRLRKQHKGVVIKFKCNREIQFDFDEVHAAWLREREKRLFDYERYRKSLSIENPIPINSADADSQDVEVEETSEENKLIQLDPSPMKSTMDQSKKVTHSMPAPGKKIPSARKSGLRQNIKQVEPFSPSEFLEDKGRRGSGSKGGSKNKKRGVSELYNVDESPDSLDAGDTDVSLFTDSDSKSSRARGKGKDPLAKNLGSYFQTLSSSSHPKQPASRNDSAVEDMLRRILELEENRYTPKSSVLASQVTPPPLDPLQLVSGSIGMVASVVHALKDLRGALKEDDVLGTSSGPSSHQPAPITNHQPASMNSSVNEELVRQNGILMEALLSQQSHTVKPPTTPNTSQVSPIAGVDTLLALQQAAQSLQQTQQQQVLHGGIVQPSTYFPLQTQYQPLSSSPLLSAHYTGNLGPYSQSQTAQNTQASNLLDVLRLLLNRPPY